MMPRYAAAIMFRLLLPDIKAITLMMLVTRAALPVLCARR